MGRLGYIDGLRGIAAFYVVVFHMAFVPIPKPTVPEWLRPIVIFGGSGVTLFFVISAFSLCLTMKRHSDTGHTILSYGVSRFFRIAPLFYILILVTLIRDAFGFGVFHSMLEVWLSLSFAFNIFPGYQEGIVWASWTIGVEMLFYLAFPFIYSWQATTNRRIVLICVALVLSMILKGVAPFFITDAAALASFTDLSVFRHFPTFLIGMAAYECYASEKMTRARQDLGGALTALGLLGLSAIIASRLTLPVIDHVHTIALAYALVLVGLSGKDNALFNNVVTRFFGRISYSIYLWHAPIIFSLGPVYRQIDSISAPATVRFMLCLFVTLTAVLPMAILTYRLIELPGVEFGRRFYLYLINRSVGPRRAET